MNEPSITEQTMARIKAEWRAEWEAEAARTADRPSLRAAAGEMVAWSVMEVRPGQYQCRVCGADVTRPTAPHEDDCEADALFAALRQALDLREGET